MRLKRLVAPLMMGLLVGVGQEAMAADSEWFCTLVLCVQDPRGMQTEGDCRPPVEKMLSYAMRGKPIPTCHFSNGTVASLGFSREYFDPCPEGTTIGRGRIALAPAPGRLPVERSANEGRVSEDSNIPLPRACVGKAAGSYMTGGGESGDPYRVTLYDRIEWQKPQSPNVIDVYIDGKLNQRVRY